ncbi:Myb-like DNA-binding domain containing protein [Histomonas meleagridis]|uniref:Myb-like DNA-binding domain containing protein n=1 Tax=Histomonas meleagridis TaxID=135588 RepID=UPI00355A36C1|nr:Myb-like DNA-binding domain containing protein [Histomonas meleagridis]KAH0798874.1 Myb-like DNA-binding domain containing protein [Histomonas meleagridis]KAH0798877.1 Myb-like DNA-binding domain containing protein [Histomonas meleagridis]KAH0801720.1 Myb-like DNA-binding domain containing protein [Histomonas meleagridis]
MINANHNDLVEFCLWIIVSDGIYPPNVIGQIRQSLTAIIEQQGDINAAVNHINMFLMGNIALICLHDILICKNYPPLPFIDTPFHQRNLNNINSWLYIEDARLLCAIHLFSRHWSRIAQFVGNGRSGLQCRQRWEMVFCNLMMQRNWTLKEDKELIKLHNIYGNDWVTISKKIGNKLNTQCRFRFMILNDLGRVPPPDKEE